LPIIPFQKVMVECGAASGVIMKPLGSRIGSLASKDKPEQRRIAVSKKAEKNEGLSGGLTETLTRRAARVGLSQRERRFALDIDFLCKAARRGNS
jgi:hypothetical protein